MTAAFNSMHRAFLRLVKGKQESSLVERLLRVGWMMELSSRKIRTCGLSLATS
ncbi:hypothetical protein ES15_3123 [Cronobacter sakazakii ES15]|nr:hypothetical protein ES15_3123 [Cronobacter sakazakii ES15]